MKANELMIGDLVNLCYRGLALKILEIGKNSILVETQDNFKLQISYDEAEILPIPLTAEILEKNFPNADKVAWWFADDYEDADDRITYEIHISGGALGINGFMWYAHELQHALRLCGLNDLADNFKI